MTRQLQVRQSGRQVGEYWVCILKEIVEIHAIQNRGPDQMASFVPQRKVTYLNPQNLV